MLLACIAVAAITSPLSSPATIAGRYEMGERLRLLDVEWLAVTEEGLRRKAVPFLTQAVMTFFQSKPGAACQALDRAIAALSGKSDSSADAITLRFIPPVAEPNAVANVRIAWAYVPEGAQPVNVSIGGKTVRVKPGETANLKVRPQRTNRDLALTPEIGYPMPARVGSEPRWVMLSIVKNPSSRAAALVKSKNPVAQAIGEAVQEALKDPGNMEFDVPIISNLFTGELLDSGRSGLEFVTHLPIVRYQSTIFRAAFPEPHADTLAEPKNVVIAIHGAGGSENMFFEGYGRGLAVREALKRGWIFVSPRASGTAVSDVLEWLRSVRKIKIGRLFVMGHSMGGMLAVQTGAVVPKPSAIALFAPATATIPELLADTPTYLAIGKQEPMPIAAGIRALGAKLSQRPNCLFEEFDPCEHLMVVEDGIPHAYDLFDRVAGSTGR